MPDNRKHIDRRLSSGETGVPRPLLGLLLRLANQHWSREVDAALAAAGFDDIRPPHANVFPFVPDEGIQIGELAGLARVRKQSMAEVIDQLEKAGYVERRPDPNDRRARLVYLTDRGAAIRPVGSAAGREVEKTWARLIGSKKLQELRTLLEELLDALAEPIPG